MTTKEDIRVVKIINSKQLVINAGLIDNVFEGENFKIIDSDKNANSVIDPVTGENLGTLNFQKAKVEVTTVYEKMSIVEAPEKQINGYSLNPADNIVAKNIRPDLDVDPFEITGGLSSENKTIRVGDLAVPED